MHTHTIVICGGHFSPALALIEELKKKKEYRLFYIGRKTALEGDSASSLEYVTLSRLSIPFHSLITGRLQRKITWFTFLSILKLPIGIVQSFYFLYKIKPQLVVSFGGYVALPVSFAASLFRIPILIHEQTPVLGIANRIMSRWAHILCLSYKKTKYIPKNVKSIYTGNLLRETIHFSSDKTITKFGDTTKPLLFVTGGSLGCRAINKAVGEALEELLKTYRIFHQCGRAHDKADFRFLTDFKKTFPSSLQKDYRLVTHVDPSRMGDIYRNAFLVIGRSGANTVAEIGALGIPALFIPLPWAADNEQEQNALLLTTKGSAEKIDQKELTGTKLKETIGLMRDHISDYRRNGEKVKKLFSLSAAKRVENVIKMLLDDRYPYG